MALAEIDLKSIRARPGSRLSKEQAQAAAHILFAIEKRDGLIKPAAVVEAAADPSSPLHKLFDWDDASAAEKHRVQQARQIMRSVVYRVQSLGKDVGEHMHAFVRVREDSIDETTGEVTPGTSGGYASVVRALDNSRLLQQIRDAAVRDVESAIRKLATIEALAKARSTAAQLLEEIKAA